MPKAYALDDPSAPKFPKKFDILKKAVLQKTDLNKNNNKYHALELHSPSAKTKKVFRVFTHYGRTDDLGYNIAEDPVSVHDLHATMLHQLGFDHERLVYRTQGRDFRLTDVFGHVVRDLIA